MRKLALTVPEVAFIAVTRGALGFGAGLLLSRRFNESRRRAVGVSLVAIGVATTILAARMLFGRNTEVTATGAYSNLNLYERQVAIVGLNLTSIGTDRSRGPAMMLEDSTAAARYTMPMVRMDSYGAE